MAHRQQLQPREECLDRLNIAHHLVLLQRQLEARAREYVDLVVAVDRIIIFPPVTQLLQRIEPHTGLEIGAEAARRLTTTGRLVALGECAEALELARDGGARQRLTRAFARKQDVLRRHELVGAVRAPKLLNDLARTPAELGHDVQPAPLVGLRLVGVQREAGRTRIRQDGDQLLARLKALPLDDVHLRVRHPLLGTRSEHVSLAPVGRRLLKQPVRPPRHLGDV